VVQWETHKQDGAQREMTYCGKRFWAPLARGATLVKRTTKGARPEEGGPAKEDDGGEAGGSGGCPQNHQERD